MGFLYSGAAMLISLGIMAAIAKWIEFCVKNEKPTHVVLLPVFIIGWLVLGCLIQFA